MTHEEFTEHHGKAFLLLRQLKELEKTKDMKYILKLDKNNTLICNSKERMDDYKSKLVR